MGGMVLETNLQEILTAVGGVDHVSKGMSDEQVKEQEELETKGSKVASAKLKLKNQLR